MRSKTRTRVSRGTKLLTIPAFAKARGLNYWGVRAMVQRGEIPSVPVGKRRRIESRWLKEWPSDTPPAAQSSEPARREIASTLLTLIERPSAAAVSHA